MITIWFGHRLMFSFLYFANTKDVVSSSLVLRGCVALGIHAVSNWAQWTLQL